LLRPRALSGKDPPAAGRALWSDDFDEPMASLFELQDAEARTA
jgi:hypothetical protein